MKTRELAERIGCSLEGDGDVEIRRVAGIDQAASGDVTFVSNSKYRPLLASTRASAVILGAGSPDDSEAPCAVLRTDQPYVAFALAVRLFARTGLPPKGVDRLSAIAADASVGPDASIGPFVTIGAGATIGARAIIYPTVIIGPGARIGDDCILHAGVSVRENVIVGHRVTVLDGAVIGSDGFGFATQKDGTHLKIPQHADVVIEDDVEIGANVTIDRPAVGETRISAGTKIDNLVHVAHGVAIGKRALLAAQVGIAGSTVIDDDVMVAGQSGITGHIDSGRGVKVGAKSAVLPSVGAGGFVTGIPAFDHAEWRKASIVFRALPMLKKRIEELEQKIAELEEKLAACRIPTDR